MPFGYPVSLEVGGHRCVVIGSEAVRAGKVEGLVAAGADDVLVLADGPQAVLDGLQHLDGVEVERRRWTPRDFDDVFLVVASAHDAADGSAIAREARLSGALVNVMDDVPNCDWAAPSVVRRGELVLAVSTGGASPSLARKLRERLAAEFGEEWVEIVAMLRRVREETVPAMPDVADRARRWANALDADEAVALVREGRADELERRLRDRLLGEEART
jgi:precorrin-2 dehydrogenase